MRWTLLLPRGHPSPAGPRLGTLPWASSPEPGTAIHQAAGRGMDSPEGSCDSEAQRQQTEPGLSVQGWPR